MTVGSLWAPSTPRYLDRYPEFFAGERGDSGGGYGPPMPSSQWKSKKGGDKKQAAMSALTLIAFLFFLNILQNCLRDQTQASPTTMVMMTRPAGNFFRDESENIVEPAAKEADETPSSNSRKLLSVHEPEDRAEASRTGKFIHTVNEQADWNNKLSDISDDDLIRQREKVEKLRKLWNKGRNSGNEEKRRVKFKKKAPHLQIEVNNVKKFINSPVMSDIKVIPKLSDYWSRKTTIPPETKTMLFELSHQKVADFKEFQALDVTKAPLLDIENSFIHDAAQSLQLRAEPSGSAEPVNDENNDDDVFNTPRYRRSEEVLTTLPTELFKSEALQVVTPDPQTHERTVSSTKTYQAYTHPSQIFKSSWKSTSAAPVVHMEAKTEETQPEKTNFVDQIYFTTIRPPRYQVKHKFYPNHREYYRPPVRYRLPPDNRRVGVEPPVVRQEYYPMSVVGQYGGEKESPLLGVLQLVWTLMGSFARPISRILPQVAKVGNDNQCLDLLACEAQRLGNFMGPTAQSLANSLSTVLTWITPEKQKMVLEEAIAAGKDNSCSNQIKQCDERSGGKSAMTMVAQLMEIQRNRVG